MLNQKKIAQSSILLLHTVQSKQPSLIKHYITERQTNVVML